MRAGSMECSKIAPATPAPVVLRAEARRVVLVTAMGRKAATASPAGQHIAYRLSNPVGKTASHLAVGKTAVHLPVGQTTEDVPVPVKKPRLDSTLPAGSTVAITPPKKPTAPPSDALDEAWGVMKDLIPWVKHQLRMHPCVTGGTGENKALHLYEPLNIKESINEADMASYQSPWDDGQCKAALRSTGLYQAGGNLIWLNPNPHGQCPSSPLCWAQVCELQENLFGPRGEKAKLTTCGRIVFPETMHAYMTDMGQLEGAAAAGESQFPLLGGQGLLMAWYSAMYEALHLGADQQVAALWQCCLTATVQLHLQSDVVQLMQASSQVSESLAQQAKHLADTFPSFVAKLAKTGISLDGSQLAQLRATGLRFNGAPVNKTMVMAAGLVQKRITPECHAVMQAIEFQFGRDIFANWYNKCMRLIQITEKQAEHLRCSVEAALEFFFHASLRMLKEDPKARKSFGTESLHNAKEGTGLVTTVLARMWLRDLCMDLVADLAQLDKPPNIVTELKQVMTWFSDFGAFAKEFPAAGAGQTAQGEPGTQVEDGDDCEVGDLADDDEEDPLEKKKKFQQACGVVAGAVLL